VVTIKCKKNSTRFWACDGSNRQLEYLTPKDFGFINAAGRTSVAAQAAAVNMGQRLRNRNVRTVKVRIDGFNLGRTAAVAGLVQAGIRVVSVTDCTEIDWHWRYRAKKRPRPYRVLF
jgi:ribosomal protein S11